MKESGRIGDAANFNGTALLRATGQSSPSIALQTGVTGEAASQLLIELGETGTLSGVYDRDRMPVDMNGDNFFNLSDVILLRNFSGSLDELQQFVGGAPVAPAPPGSR